MRTADLVKRDDRYQGTKVILKVVCHLHLNGAPIPTASSNAGESQRSNDDSK